MFKANLERAFFAAFVLFLSASCGGGTGDQDAGDSAGDIGDILELSDPADMEVERDIPEGGDPDGADVEDDREIPVCGNGKEDGIVCGEDPRRICIGGICVPSTCGDGFADTGAGEECDDGGNGDPDDGCTDTCGFSCHENADCEDMNSCTLDVCGTATSHVCIYSASPFGTPCRLSAGECDVDEYCDGVNFTCPDDAFVPPTTECRLSVSTCDVAEFCTGTSAFCPEDGFAPSGSPCDDSIFCTNPDECDGAGACVGTPVTELYGVSDIATSIYSTRALMNNGVVKSWGDNFAGQLGDGTMINRPTPVDVVGLSMGVSVITTGYYHTCVVTSTGGVKCWGYCGSGSCGDGGTTQRLTPVDVVGLSSGVVSVACGWSISCALTSTGGVKCWGNNYHGQLGDSTTTQRLTPVDVVGLSTGVSAIAAGENHTCALMSTGGVKCWGYNFYGQLGDGTTTERHTPVDVSGLSTGVTAIGTGLNHTCVLMSSGGVKCWGFNFQGQLGDGTTTQRLTPVDVSGLSTGVSTIAVGPDHNCVLTSAGSMKCWGENFYGQLGDGTTTNSPTPIDVLGLPAGISDITGGSGHTCVILSTGGVKCWGYNHFGQLGDGTTTDSLTPVDVLCE